MLRFPCLVLDHDDTVVQSEKTIGHPFFQMYLQRTRPGTSISLADYVRGCCQYGFADMCRIFWNFSEEELKSEYEEWMDYVRCHVADPYPGIREILQKHIANDGRIFVVSHSSDETILRDYQIHFGIRPDGIYSWDLPEEKRKPAPYALEDIMEKWGYTKDQILVVDDLMLGCTMARKVGVSIAFAGWSKDNLPELAKEMEKICDYSFCSTAELDSFLFP